MSNERLGNGCTNIPMNQDHSSKNTPAGRRSSLVMGHWFLVIFLYALDQITKRLIVVNFDSYSTIQVVPGWFNIVYVINTGAAFGSFKDSNPFFIGISAVTLVALLVFQWRGAFRDGWTKSGTALLMAGILGNLTDRLLCGHVIDFLDFHAGVHHWPSFNVADSCICVAVGLFIIGSIVEERRKKAGATV